MGGHRASDDPRSIIAVVRAGDDSAGGWYSGSLIPEATELDAVERSRAHEHRRS
jgi:hypothetical protein